MSDAISRAERNFLKVLITGGDFLRAKKKKGSRSHNSRSTAGAKSKKRPEPERFAHLVGVWDAQNVLPPAMENGLVESLARTAAANHPRTRAVGTKDAPRQGEQPHTLARSANHTAHFLTAAADQDGSPPAKRNGWDKSFARTGANVSAKSEDKFG